MLQKVAWATSGESLNSTDTIRSEQPYGRRIGALFQTIKSNNVNLQSKGRYRKIITHLYCNRIVISL